MAQPSDVIAWKFANALIPDAEPSRTARAFAFFANPAVDQTKRAIGGLWVGGTVTLTRDTLSFGPNAMNRALHAGETSRSLPLSRIVEVTDRFGWLTRIVDVRTDDGQTLTFRCFGARAFAEQIRRAARTGRN